MSCTGPDNITVQLHNDAYRERLCDLIQLLMEHSTKNPPTYIPCKIGEYVCVKRMKHPYRAVVKAIDMESKSATVLLTEFGDVTEVSQINA